MGAPLGNKNAVGNVGGHGKPTLYDPNYHPTHAKKFSLLGASFLQLAEMFDVSPMTIHNWKHRYPEFREALSEGKEIADANVAASCYRRAIGYEFPSEKIFCYDGAVTRVDITEHVPPDVAAQKYWLNNRRPDLWKDRREHAVVIADLAKFDDTALRERIAADFRAGTLQLVAGGDGNFSLAVGDSEGAPEAAEPGE